MQLLQPTWTDDDSVHKYYTCSITEHRPLDMINTSKVDKALNRSCTSPACTSHSALLRHMSCYLLVHKLLMQQIVNSFLHGCHIHIPHTCTEFPVTHTMGHVGEAILHRAIDYSAKPPKGPIQKGDILQNSLLRRRRTLGKHAQTARFTRCTTCIHACKIMSVSAQSKFLQHTYTYSAYHSEHVSAVLESNLMLLQAGVLYIYWDEKQNVMVPAMHLAEHVITFHGHHPDLRTHPPLPLLLAFPSLLEAHPHMHHRRTH